MSSCVGVVAVGVAVAIAVIVILMLPMRSWVRAGFVGVDVTVGAMI